MKLSNHDGEDFEKANLLLAKFYVDKVYPTFLLTPFLSFFPVLVQNISAIWVLQFFVLFYAVSYCFFTNFIVILIYFLIFSSLSSLSFSHLISSYLAIDF